MYDLILGIEIIQFFLFLKTFFKFLIDWRFILTSGWVHKKYLVLTFFDKKFIPFANPSFLSVTLFSKCFDIYPGVPDNSIFFKKKFLSANVPKSINFIFTFSFTLLILLSIMVCQWLYLFSPIKTMKVGASTKSTVW